MIRPEIKTKWVNALRSGKYSQTKSCLKDDKGFCCLGVLTDIYISEHENAEWEKVSSEYAEMLDLKDRGEVSEFNGTAEMLSPEVYKWVSGADDTYYAELKIFLESDFGPSKVTLWELNDIHEYSFDQIADLIEEQL
jgi:hypothetical protein